MATQSALTEANAFGTMKDMKNLFSAFVGMVVLSVAVTGVSFAEHTEAAPAATDSAHHDEAKHKHQKRKDAAKRRGHRETLRGRSSDH